MGANNLTDARRTAKANGQRHYLTGAPCKRGHLTSRLTANGSCVECTRERGATPEAKARDHLKYLRNAAAVKARAAAWAIDNPERARASARARDHNKRARDAGCVGIVSIDDVLAIWQAYGGKCCVCASTDRPCLDHVAPLSAKGLNVRENLQVLCFSCNARKNDRPMDVFLAERTAT